MVLLRVRSMAEIKLLIVDDEVEFTKLVKTFFERFKTYEVRCLNDSAECIETVKSFKPNIVLLDINMPTLDGGAVASQIEDAPGLAGTRIIFISAIVSREEASHIGNTMHGYPFLSKPISLESLYKVVEQYLKTPSPRVR